MQSVGILIANGASLFHPWSFAIILKEGMYIVICGPGFPTEYQTYASLVILSIQVSQIYL